MINQQAVVDHIVQNLAFEIEAVPKNKSVEAISQNTPLNVKIRVRKKDEMHPQPNTNDHQKAVQNIRLVSSDQTIMTFDVFMEAEFEKKPSGKSQKNIFNKLKPGLCLGATDEDEYPYMPSSSYSANITEPTVATRSDGTLKQTFRLSKNVYQDYTATAHPQGHKWLFGKCRPGGCLDPPFSEDKYSYKPSIRTAVEHLIPESVVPESETLPDEDDIECDDYSNRTDSKQHDDDVKSNGKHSSIFDGTFFKKKRKSSDKSTNTKLPDKTDSILSIYNIESADNSSTHSNPIITYPPKISSDLKISDEKTAKSRGPSEDKSRKSFNDHSEPYFIPPKGVNRLKGRDSLKSSDNPKRSSDVGESTQNPKDSSNVPVAIPVPIPIPVPLFSKKDAPKNPNTNADILKTQGDTNIIDVELTPDEGVGDKSTSEKAKTPPQQIQEQSATGDSDVRPKETIKTKIPEKVEQQAPLIETGHEPDDKISETPILESRGDAESYDSATEPSNKSIDSKLYIAASADSNTSSDMKILQSEQPLPEKTVINKSLPEKTEDKSEYRKDFNEIPIGRSGNRESLSSAAYSQNSEVSDNAPALVPEKYSRQEEVIRLSHDLVNQENDIAEDEKTISKITLNESDKYKNDANDKNNLEDNSDTYKEPETYADEIKIIENDAIDDTIKDDIKINYNNSDMENLSHNAVEKGLDSGNTEMSPPFKIKENETASTKPKQIIEPINIDKVDGYNESPKFTNNGSLNFITAPVIIDNTSTVTQQYVQLKQVHSETNFFADPTVETYPVQFESRFREDDNVTQLTVSHELIGTNSVIYDADDYIPSAPMKNIERYDKHVLLPADTGKGILDSTKSFKKLDQSKGLSNEFENKLPNKNNIRRNSVLSDIPSTSTLKSALKKDIISVELGFCSYLNEKNERILKTFDTANTSTRFSNTSVTVIKSQIRISSNEIRIPIDAEHDVSIKIKKAIGNQRVSISESGFVNVIDGGSIPNQKTAVQRNGEEFRNPEVQESDKIVKSVTKDDNVIDLYEQELVPLQLIIKNLRDEIDVLAAQQLIFKDKIFCQNKSKMPRLIHSDKKCYGCLRK